VPPRKRILQIGGLLGAGIVLLALPSVGFADDPASLRAHGSELAAAEHSARLELFALESRLASANTALSGIESRLTGVERERDTSRRQLRAARRTLALAEQRLADQVRILYIEEEPDFLSIFLGASSLENAIDGIDNLQRAAGATNTVVDEAKVARAHVTRLVHSLTARRNDLRGLRAAAAARARELAQAQSARLAYIDRLRAEQVLNDQQIAQAVAGAGAAQSAASLETVKAQATPSISSIGTGTVVPVQPPQQQQSPQAPASRSGRTLTVVATAYTMRGTTATGIRTGPGVVAVDPTVIPLGTTMTIPGYGEGVAADTGSAIKGLRIDLWVATAAEAAKWQWQTVTITLH
jgi:3D (Asp-Asp-Asp) domain-containing protein